jgi:hypothetical protein
MDVKMRRRHNATYRARRGGSDVDTRGRTIYRTCGDASAASPAERILLREYHYGVQYQWPYVKSQAG